MRFLYATTVTKLAKGEGAISTLFDVDTGIRYSLMYLIGTDEDTCGLEIRAVYSLEKLTYNERTAVSFWAQLSAMMPDIDPVSRKMDAEVKKIEANLSDTR